MRREKVLDKVKVEWSDVKGTSHVVILSGKSAYDLLDTVREAFKSKGIKYNLSWKHGNWYERLFWRKLYTIEDLEERL